MSIDATDSTIAVAQYVHDLCYDDLPAQAITNAKIAILDTIGVSLAGSQQEVGKLIVDYVATSCPGGSATIFGNSVKSNPEYAALANGTIAHAMDYDDRGHASTHVFTAPMAVAEGHNVSGKDLLLAYIVGREVRLHLDEEFDGARFDARGPGSRGWHATGTLGSIGATAAVAKILDLDVFSIASAFGVASSLASGLMANFGMMAKPIHAGNAARNGVLSATLVSKGFTGEPTVFDTRLGLVNAMCLPNECDMSKAVKTLTSYFHIVEKGVQIKPYPSCSGSHPYAESMKFLKEKYNLTPESIASIEVSKTGGLRRLYPESGLECKFSAAYVMAVILLEGTFQQKHCTEEYLNREDVQGLLAKTIYSGPWGNKRFIKITTVDGEVIDEPVLHWRNLTEYDEIRAKFLENSVPVVGEEKAARIEAMVNDLENARVDDLTALIH